MTVTDRSPTPVRPRGVPDEAEYNPELREWIAGTRDEAGRWQGEVVGYRADGSRASLQHFHDGRLDGASLRYHPNGEVARRARYVSGRPVGELRATASTEASPERLRSCCVPANAWSLVARYDEGQLEDEWFEDNQGRRLLSDGSLRPEKPHSVPPEAWFDESARRWCEGRHMPKGGRDGKWRWWSEDGELLDEREFDEGKLSGAATSKRIAPGTFRDSRISGWSGHFQAGQRALRWRFYDPSGELVCEREFGVPCTALGTDHPVFGAKESDPSALSRELMAQGHTGLGLCALVRHAAASGDFEALQRALAAHTVPLSPAASQRQVTEFKRQKKDSLATWVQALVDGVEPAVSFSKLGMLLLKCPSVGFDFATAAVEVSPDDRRFRLTRALLGFELGDPAGALTEADELESDQPAAARLIRDYHRILFSPSRFIPAGYTPETPPNPELPAEVNQPLARVRATVEKYAMRLSKIRERLIELHGCDPNWLPPDVTELLDGSAQLDCYTFEESDEEEGVEVIQVDERLVLDGAGTTSLLRRARLEWAGLCWLCWGVGLDRVSQPESIVARADFAAVLSSSLFRVYRISDSLQTRGLRSKTQGLPSTNWEGSDVDSLDNLFAGMAKDEAYEMRAVLFFLADERCRSPWQDDLREG